jgi:hypothetical protein
MGVIIVFLQVDWSKALHVLLNIILVSIPEEIFLVVFTLILLNQFDYLQSKVDGENRLKKIDIYRISLIVVTVAVITNILRFYFFVDASMIFIISIIMLFLLILITYKLYFLFKDILKVLLFTVISCIVILVVESLYIPIILLLLNKTIEEINNSILLNFMVTIPGRVLEIIIIAYIITKKASFFNNRIFRTILESKKLLLTSIIYLIFNISMLLIILELVFFDRTIAAENIFMQMLATVLGLVVPVLNIFIYFSIIYHNKSKELNRTYEISSNVNMVLSDIRRLTKVKQYDKILPLIIELEENISNVHSKYMKGK